MNEVTTLSNIFQQHLSWDKRRCDVAASYIIAALKVCTVKKHGRLPHPITAYGLQELQHSLLHSQYFRQVLISFLGLLSCT
jgi:hypothetical protein